MADVPKDIADFSRIEVGVDPVLEERVKKQSDKLYEGAKRTMLESWAVGKDLTAAKKQVKHGYWIPWVEQKIGLNRRVAQRLMELYKRDPQKRRLSLLGSPSEMLRALPPAGRPSSKGQRARAGAGETSSQKGKGKRSGTAGKLARVVAQLESRVTEMVESGVRQEDADLQALVGLILVGITAVDKDLKLRAGEDQNTVELSDEVITKIRASLEMIIERQQEAQRKLTPSTEGSD